MYQYALSILDKFSKPMKAFDKLMSSGVQKVRKLHGANKKLPSSLGQLRAKLELLEDAKERAFSVAEIARYNQKILVLRHLGGYPPKAIQRSRSH